MTENNENNMIDSGFCLHLEYKIGEAFEFSDNEEVKGFWCDGVMLSEPNSNYSQKFVNDNRAIILTAFIGKDGQSKYELLLKFGRKSLSRYARNLDIKECIPNIEKTDWFIIDTKLKKIEIQLD